MTAIGLVVFGSFSVWATFEISGLALAFALLLALQLAVLIAFDIRHMLLPNLANAILALTGLAAALSLEDGELLERLSASLTGFASLAVLAWFHRRLRHREGLGMGDAKLFGALGAWVGLLGLPALLCMAAGGGLIFALIRAAFAGGATLNQRLPFGPFLILSGWVVWLYGPLTFA